MPILFVYLGRFAALGYLTWLYLHNEAEQEHRIEALHERFKAFDVECLASQREVDKKWSKHDDQFAS